MNQADIWEPVLSSLCFRPYSTCFQTKKTKKNFEILY